MKLITPTSGDIRFEGASIGGLSSEQERAYRRSVQMVFQDPYSSLNPRMTVGSIIGYPMRIQNAYPGPARDARIRELLELVGLSRFQASWYPHEFSGGERQRVGIAAALALNPKFIFCDEPVSSLDVSAQAQILNLLKDVRREFNLTILIVTHNLSVVEYLSDRVVVMYLGKIVEIAGDRRSLPGDAPPVHQGAGLGDPDPRSRCGARAGADHPAGGDPEPARSAHRMPLPHPVPVVHRRRLPRRRAAAAASARPATSRPATSTPTREPRRRAPGAARPAGQLV